MCDETMCAVNQNESCAGNKKIKRRKHCDDSEIVVDEISQYQGIKW